MVPSVMMVVPSDVSARGETPWRGHCRAGECDCRESGDEFDLVHGVVPFFITRKPILALTLS